MQEVSLKDASKILKCSTKTIRRKIHAGTLSARLVSGPKGPEYRILLEEPEIQKSGIRSQTRDGTEVVEKLEFIPHFEKVRGGSPASTNLQKPGAQDLNYQKLYREVSAKYEQSLMLIGRLQAELDKKLPQLEAEASSIKEKYDLLKLSYDEKHKKLQEHQEALATKEYVITELSKELDKAYLELKKRQSPFYGIKKLFGLA